MSSSLPQDGTIERVRRFIQLSPWREAMMRLDDELEPNLSNLVPLVSRLPLPVWAALVYDPSTYLVRARDLLPAMPDPDLQRRSLGATGEELLDRSVAFMRSVMALVGPSAVAGNVVELGAGWGRLTRLLLKYVHPSRLYGLEPLRHNLILLKDQRVPGRFDVLPMPGLPGAIVEDASLVVSAQLFLRLAPEAFEAILTKAAASLAPGGHLVIAVRPPEYWLLPHRADPDLVVQTYQSGIAHVPSATDHLGETAVTLEWLGARLRAAGMGSPSVDWNPTEPYVLVCHSRRAS